ncbi:GGDEF domain-containing protein [Oxalobacteraceae bacterium A2-2]
MDAFTLVVTSGLASAIMAVTMLLLYRASSRAACLLDWSAAGTLFLASNAVAFVAGVTDFKHPAMPALGNAFYIGGHFMIAAGLRRHLGLRPRHALLAALLAGVPLLHLLPFTQSSVLHRLLLLTPLIAACNAHVVWCIWRLPPGEAKPSYLPLMLVEGAFMLQLVVRALWIALAGGQLTYMGNQLSQTIGSLSVLVFLSAGVMSCALIVMRQQELALRRAALRDSLTGWYNRRALQEQARRAFQRFSRGGTAPAFIVFDIDYFKRINDRHGHAVGDAAIVHATRVAGCSLRGYDALFRTGGEEFAVLVEDTGAPACRQMAERLRAAIAAEPLQAEGHEVGLTVSVGLALAEPGEDWEALLRRADQALYLAKQSGRNRVCVHGEAVPTAAMAAPVPAWA